MLTDIFANRYSGVVLRESFTDVDRRLLVQCFRILSEQICPYYMDGKESDAGKAYWSRLNGLLSMELGLSNLSPTHFNYQQAWNGQTSTQVGTWTMVKVCENWMLKAFDGSEPADWFIKERLSLVELGFRMREQHLAAREANIQVEISGAELLAKFKTTGRIGTTGDVGAGIRAQLATQTSSFNGCVVELNTRFRQAGYDLNYHNGFIQRTKDELTEQQVERPFWKVVGDPKWKNVDTDIKEALDRRDTNARDPAFYAARALESAIKIISDEKGWTHGGERGAHSYIDNLAAKKNGLLSQWESDTLKNFFSAVRNPLGHGPGSAEMPSLTQEQTDWAIETCMSWIRSLIQRL